MQSLLGYAAPTLEETAEARVERVRRATCGLKVQPSEQASSIRRAKDDLG